MRRSFKKFICSLVVATAVMSATPCVNGLGLETTITAEAATKKVALSKKTVSVAVAGKSTVQLKNTSSKKKVTWTSSNKKVATVKAGKNGKATITGKKAGKAAITGKYAGKKYTVKVTVKAPALSKKSLSLTAGKNGTITLNNIVSTKKITWKSSKTSVATVKAGKNGKVTITGKKAGTANITATYNGKKYTCKVTVKGKVAAPKLSKTSLSLTAGKSGSITLNNPVKGKGVTAKSSNTKVATVKVSSNKITITAKAKGTATVTVSHNGKSYKCTVKVAAKATTTPVKQPETQPSTEPSKVPETNAPTKPSTPNETTPSTEPQKPVTPVKPTQPETEKQTEAEPQKPTQPSTESGVVIGGGETEAGNVDDKTTEPGNQKPDEGNNGNDNSGDNNGNGGDTLKQWYEAPVGSYLVQNADSIIVVLSTGTNGTARTISKRDYVNDAGIEEFTNVTFDGNASDGNLICSYDAVKGTGSADGSTVGYRRQYFRGDCVGYYNYNGVKTPMYQLIEKTAYTNGQVIVNMSKFDVQCDILLCYCGVEFHTIDYANTPGGVMDAWFAHTKSSFATNDVDMECWGYTDFGHIH